MHQNHLLFCKGEEINAAQKRIATYKEEFANAKEIRQHRQGKLVVFKIILNITSNCILLEYDLLAKVIQQQPNRQDTERYFVYCYSVLLLV